MLIPNKVLVDEVKGIGPKRAKALADVGIKTISDMIYYRPRKYIDRSNVTSIAQCPIGEEVTLIVKVAEMQFVRGRKPRFILSAVDDKAELKCIWFTGANYMQNNFNIGDELALSGMVEVFSGKKQMLHPEFEFTSSSDINGSVHTGIIIPVYTSSGDMKERGLRSRGYRRLVRQLLNELLPNIEDPIPVSIIKKLNFFSLSEALEKVHFPKTIAEAEEARRRLAFDEFYEIQLRLAKRKKLRINEKKGNAFKPSNKLLPLFYDLLPFVLTSSQKRVISDVFKDMYDPVVMYRLIQGDVGSGKTLIGLCAMLTAVEQGFQAALMVPTEILAEQHFLTLNSFAEALKIEVVLLKGNQRATERRKIVESIASGEAQIIVGTHALIQNEIEYQRLGLVVVDEQHRFGVTQRSALFKKGTNPDMLVMTATPIPRSLALTMYGDLDVSIVDELPPGRQAIRTARRKPERRMAIFDFLVDQIRQGRQAYIVYPLVEESEELGYKSAVEAYKELKTGVLSDFELGLLHGRLASDEKASIMEDFKLNRLQCLVCTTVIEVGLDVPNATVMIIEHAERFGLAQLHQLRGRVGRGSEESYCILISEESEENKVSKGGDRLDALVANQDGFALADRDLELRGPGEFFGNRQAGMPEFKMADIIRDADLLEIARREVEFSFPEEKTK